MVDRFSILLVSCSFNCEMNVPRTQNVSWALYSDEGCVLGLRKYIVV